MKKLIGALAILRMRLKATVLLFPVCSYLLLDMNTVSYLVLAGIHWN
jgi:hypothetical protein